MREPAWVGGHAGEHQPLFIIVLAEDLVVAQVESIAHAEPGQRNFI